jgi:hypothetical protein
MKLSKIILSESTKVTDLQGLTFDLLVSMFIEKPMFGFSLPNPDDSSRSIHAEDDLNRWKAGIEKKYGNVKIKIDTKSESPWDRVQVLDDKFRKDKESYTAGKAAWLDKERAAGRTYGLD